MKLLFLMLAIFLPALFGFIGSAHAQEEVGGEIILNAGQTADNAEYKTLTISQGVGNIIEAALLVIGVIFMSLMVYGGYLWLTARGNSSQVDTAQEIVKNAVIGIVIVFTAYVFTVFIIRTIAGSVQYNTDGSQNP